MTSTRLLPVAALLCVAALAGCGSSNSSSNSSNSTPAAAQTSSSTGSQTSSTPSVPTRDSAQVAAAVAECKSLIAAQTKLPDGAKHKLEAACSKAAKGDTNAVKQAAREVCEEIVDTSSLPTADRETAKAACRK